MPINATTSSRSAELTRKLNSMNLAKLDAAKLLAAQLDAQQERKIDGDRAAERLADQLRQVNARDSRKEANETSADESIDRDDRAKRDRQRQLVRVEDEDVAAPTLSSLMPPKAQLSPTDELALFAETSGTRTSTIAADAQSAQLLTNVNAGEAVAEDGSSVDVEIIAPQTQADSASALVLTLTSRAQAATAALYARNSDVVFQTYPLDVAA